MNITIEGQVLQANDGDTILDVARRNNIQIPTICFLSGCSPTLACKMCMVEVNGKRVYSCNAKVKDGMDVVVHNEELQKDRNEIMTTYCVNHPLECGVCDKSGECELQDFTLYTQVDVQQFGLQEADKKPYSFAQSFYDPALCIMCERCVTTCKDNIGEANLKVGKANLFTPDHHKDSMGKDPYSVWAKRQKGLIEFVGKNECKDCGECIAVCPVGAMTYKDFTYTSNAWELEKVHSTCTHCAGGCELIYNVKHLDVKGDLQKVYRVQNDFLYNPICGAGRFAFDMVSTGSRNTTALLQAFQRADSIYIGSDVSNEEALIADYIAKKLNIPLINHEAYCLQHFGNHFLQARKLYEAQFSADRARSDVYQFFATFEDFKTSPSFISLHTYFKNDSPIVRYRLNNNLKMQKNSQVISISLFKDTLLESLGKNITQIQGDSANVSLMGLLGLVFANDLIDDFEECFPNSLSAFMKREDQKIEGFYIQKEGDETKDSTTKDSSQDVIPHVTQEAALQDAGVSDKEEVGNTDSIETQSKVDNLSPYDTSIIANALNIADLSSLKLTKKDGILMISRYVFDEFLEHDFTSSDGYGLQSHFTDKNPPTIENAVATAIMEGITESVRHDIMDQGVKLQILAHLVAFVCDRLNLALLYIPKGTNTLGVANLCDLTPNDNIESRYSIGIRTKGNFVIDSNLSTIKPHFPLPTLAQSEGSVTNMENRVLPLIPSVPYLDSCLEPALDLSDIAKELEALPDELSSLEYLGDFTEYLFMNNAMYKRILHKDLKATFERDGRDNRGYMLLLDKKEIQNSLEVKFSLCPREIIGYNALLLETQNQFNNTTRSSNNLQSKSGVYASKAYMQEHGFGEGDSIYLIQDDIRIESEIYCDHEVDTMLLLVSPMIENVRALFQGYFSASLEIIKVSEMDKECERNRA
ncbi:2Fe-2S iron-sulfur cluster-binding protein [Helicobacter trogontum]|uniref:2Fe-2S iron-sulfur cluster binding domain-containing protein n=1 Tax=Helicobacter trogontum TaxID=50960 RepID=A0A4U8TA74_9HELI|nr:2Fe-2S iron-sulfur cluster-binding protein [Helicobacter trogontum]TLD96705.1 2Fe-2S iron-sulfur cluster binding domain-containing protein [Helicobacter trogontum]